MQKIRDIIQLYVNGYSYRKISKITGIHRKVVTFYISCVTNSQASAEEALLLNEENFLDIFKKDKERTPFNQKQLWLNDFIDYARQEIKKKHVTRQLLYQEYQAKYTSVFSYSHFCVLLNKALDQKEYSLFQSFSPGEIMMADFAGDKLHYIVKETGELKSCEVLVVTLGYSGYTFVTALSNQTQESFIEGLNDALLYFGGSPRIVRFDNLKAGVVKSDPYEPQFNTLASMFCQHNNMVADATRVNKPKDKAQVESHVNIVYKRIYGPLRNHNFYSVNEINYAIKIHLKDHNSRPYRGTSRSRKDFHEEEKGSLTPLPEQLFKRKYIKTALVQKNYHIWLGHDEHYYSIPYKYVGSKVTVIYDHDMVEVYYEYSRIAIHQRMHKVGRYSTLVEHMPESHMAVKNGLDPQWLKKQASAVGEHVLLFSEKLLDKGLLTPQHFKSCQGVIALARKYPKERVDKACKRALDYNSITYKSVLGILEKNLDALDTEDEQASTPHNPNTRGQLSFL